MDRTTARQLIEYLNEDAEHIASHFGLRYRSITAERANVKSRYGVCYSDGVIKIRLRHAVTGKPLKYSSLVSTLCHELAHLRHFNHGPLFRAFYLQVLEYARGQGIYRPRASRPASGQQAPRRPLDAPRRDAPNEPPGATQLSLFG